MNVLDYTFDITIKNEFVIYEAILNEIKLAIDHEMYPYQYHGCEFVNELIYRCINCNVSKFFVLPKNVLYVFLLYINNNDCYGLNFCNFLCEGQEIDNNLEINPYEVMKLFRGTSRIVFNDDDCNTITICNVIYKFLYNLSYDNEILSDVIFRKLIYNMAKIFKHKSTLTFSENQDKVNEYFKICKQILRKHKTQFKFYQTFID